MSGTGPWAWHPHPVLWVAVVAVGVSVPLLHRRLQRSSDTPSRWERVRITRFVGSLVVTVVAMGWPLGDLAANWSLMALVLQRCVLVLGAWVRIGQKGVSDCQRAG